MLLAQLEIILIIKLSKCITNLLVSTELVFSESNKYIHVVTSVVQPVKRGILLHFCFLYNLFCAIKIILWFIGQFVSFVMYVFIRMRLFSPITIHIDCKNFRIRIRLIHDTTILTLIL